MSLLIKGCPQGQVQVQLPEGCLQYVGFAAYRLSLGESLALSAGDHELCVVVLAGRLDLEGMRQGKVQSAGAMSAAGTACSKTGRPTPSIYRPIPRSGSVP